MDPVTEFISIITPAIVAECAQHTFNTNQDNLLTFTDKVTTAVISSCNQEPNDDVEPDPIQRMKEDLTEFFNEMKVDLINELRDTIKMEIRMEMFLEIENLKSMINQTSQSGQVNRSSQLSKLVNNNKPSLLGTFSTQIGSSVSNENTKLTKQATTSLEDNPLYALVTKNLERFKAGTSCYTAEEIIEMRGERFDPEQRDAFRDNAKKFEAEMAADVHERIDNEDNEDSEEEARWELMMKMHETRNM